MFWFGGSCNLRILCVLIYNSYVTCIYEKRRGLRTLQIKEKHALFMKLVLRSTTAPPRRSRQFWNREILNQQPFIEQQKPHVYLAQMGVFRPCEESIFSFIFWHNLYLTALYLFFICWHSLLKFDCTISERELKYFNALSLKHSIKLSYFSESDQLYFYGNVVELY